MKHTLPKLHIGLRTIKTAVAVIVSLIITEILGTTDSKMIFAMLGAMSAVQPSFTESLEACLAQIIGVVFGALCSILLCALPLPPLVAIGIGIILVITLYNILQIRYSPSLPCFILVLACTTANVEPFSYATGRIWDTTIGLIIGMLINMLVFPYDNSQQIRATASGLEKNVLQFLAELFDGDDILPDIQQMKKAILTLEKQLKLFSNQKLLLKLRRQSREIASFQACEEKAQALIASGAVITDQRIADSLSEKDTVTNYHVAQILSLREALLAALET